MRHAFLVTAISAAAVALIAVPVGASGRLPQCADVAVSPRYGDDHALACLSHGPGGTPPTLYLSSNGGRTWRTPVAAGVTGDLTTSGSVEFSPLFAQDATLYWATSDGLFKSTDGGATFTNVNPLESYTLPQDRPTLFAGQLAPLGAVPNQGQVVSVLAAGGSAPKPSWLHQVAAEHPVAGTPIDDIGFAVTPSGIGLAVGRSDIDNTRPQDGTEGSLWSCDATWTCATKLGSFGRPGGGYQYFFQRAWISPAFSADHSIVLVTTRTRDRRLQLWRSTDGGHTITAWSGPQRALDRLPGPNGSKQIGLTFSPDGRHLWLRLRCGGIAEEVWTSGDSGHSWIRAAYGRQHTAAGSDTVIRTGTLPWDAGAVWLTSDEFAVAGSTLFASGVTVGTDDRPTYQLYASTDGGRTWRNHV